MIIFKRQEEQARSMRDTQKMKAELRNNQSQKLKEEKSLKKEEASSSKWQLRGHEDKMQERLVSK